MIKFANQTISKVGTFKKPFLNDCFSLSKLVRGCFQYFKNSSYDNSIKLPKRILLKGLQRFAEDF